MMRVWQKSGFKNLPQGWEIVRLGDVAEIIMGSSPKSSAYNNVGDGLPLIQGKGDLKDRYPVPKCYTSKITKTCKEGDIILSVRAPVGYVAKSTYDACIGRGVCAIRAKNGDFLYFVLICMENAWVGRGSIFEAVNKDEVKKFRLPLPPLKEQEKIAEILNLWDAQIAEVQDLIYHKQRLKTGLMQKLLTQSLRLKGFAESWNKVRLGDIGSTYGGLTKKTKEDFKGGNGRYITYKNIFDNSCIDVSKFEAVRIKDGERQNQVERGDIFFTISSETPEEVGMSSVLLDDVGVVFLNSFCFGYRADKSVLDSNFARFYFRGFDFRRRMHKLAQGTTRFNLSKNKVMDLCIPLPSLKEQEKIAEILSVADEEIELLVQKHQALETQKRALMQRLLTGKVRV